MKGKEKVIADFHKCDIFECIYKYTMIRIIKIRGPTQLSCSSSSPSLTIIEDYIYRLLMVLMVSMSNTFRIHIPQAIQFFFFHPNQTSHPLKPGYQLGISLQTLKLLGKKYKIFSSPIGIFFTKYFFRIFWELLDSPKIQCLKILNYFFGLYSVCSLDIENSVM